jgi:hypothetical protein
MAARELAALVRDRLLADPCLAPYLETEAIVVHGTDAACGQPLESHPSPGIRREEQGWPGDFRRCVVTFGRFSRSPVPGIGLDRSRETWTFVISGFARSTVKDENGVEQPGDLWLMDVYDIVTRIMTTHPGTDAQACAGAPVLVAWREHSGDVRELGWDEALGAWVFQTRFRWWAIGPGVRPKASPCCLPT